jgi:hypothetical protein
MCFRYNCLIVKTVWCPSQWPRERQSPSQPPVKGKAPLSPNTLEHSSPNTLEHSLDLPSILFDLLMQALFEKSVLARLKSLQITSK